MTHSSGSDAPVNPYLIGPASPAAAGDRRLVDTLIGMLGSARHYLLRATRELEPHELGAFPEGLPNPIGALLSHLIAAETMFQNLTAEGVTFRPGIDDDQKAPFRFQGDPLAGEGIAAYHARLAAVRGGTRALLGEVDDSWLAGAMTFAGQPSNRHYYWHHYLQDEVRHTGQIILIRKHLLPGADGGFDPYAPM